MTTLDENLEYRIGCSIPAGDAFCEHILAVKKEDGDEAKDAPAKPAWKASAAEGLRVNGLSCLLNQHPDWGLHAFRLR